MSLTDNLDRILIQVMQFFDAVTKKSGKSPRIFIAKILWQPCVTNGESWKNHIRQFSKILAAFIILCQLRFS